MIKLNKKEWELIKKHLCNDISFGSQGTFYKIKNNEYEYDDKEANKVIEIIQRVDREL